MLWSSFIPYMLISIFTPGPNTITAMVNAGKHGFRKGLRFNVGVLAGFFLLMLCCAAFSSLLQTALPAIKPYMTWLGAAYLLWLAWVTLRDRPHRTGRAPRLQTNSVLTGALLQFVNIKVILYGITAFSGYILRSYTAWPTLALFALGMACVGFISTSCWALFGSVFDRLFSRHRRALNAVMALLLVYCAASLLL
ncbi:MAG: LysE family transporter [Oscillospiraceae bacterium]|jgi:threonine/homoserine/homoserine lactone efflux protein|nr:LysE family transporter [Oscillospiraceae bacterium]